MSQPSMGHSTREQQVSEEEMEHYMMFPDLYCRRHDGGAGPLCIDCINAEADEAWAQAQGHKNEPGAGR